MHRLLTGPLSVEKLTVAIADLPQTLQGLKLVQLSDLHYDGLRLSEKLLADAIEATNQLEPDLIVLTGDYVTDDPAPIHRLVLSLKNLQSRLGVYAVLGNHDLYYRQSKAEVMAALESIGIQVLWNQIAYPVGEGLPLVGLADFWSGEFDPAPVMAQLSAEVPRIVLSHNPDSAQMLQQWRIDLQLSGHTHGGQIILPGLGNVSQWYDSLQSKIPAPIRRFIPFVKADDFRVVKHWEWAKGFHQVGPNQLYVNRGLGTYLPGRLFCSPEVTLITLATA